MSDPKTPGVTPPATESDSTIIRPVADIAGVDSGGTRANRVREWAKRNSPKNAHSAPPVNPIPAPPVTPAGAAPSNPPGTPVPPVAPVTSVNGIAPAPVTVGSGASGQQLFRPADPTLPGSSINPPTAETTVLKDPAGEQSATADEPPTEANNFFGKVKARAKTIGAGVAGAAAGVADREPTGAAAGAVPAPDLGEETGSVPRAGVARRTRKARLRLSQVDPWSVMKTAFLFSIAAGIVLWVATGTVWAVISASGMFAEINKMVGDVIQTPGDDTPFRIQDYISTSKVMGTAALIAVIDVVIFTALATLGAFLYNLASAMIGGLEITLAED